MRTAKTHIGKVRMLATQTHSGTVQGGGSNLLTAADFTYLGAFRLPLSVPGTEFGFRGAVIAYDPNDGGMFVHCGQTGGDLSPFNSRICKVSIPALSTSGSLANLNRASITIPATDVITGRSYSPAMGNGENDSTAPKGMHVFGSKLVWTADQFYPGTPLIRSHGRCNLDLTNPEGMSQPATGVNARYSNMGMCDIPTEFQGAFGGHTAMGCRAGGSIVSLSSDGPALTTFNHADIGGDSFPATLRQHYTVAQLDPLSGTSRGDADMLWVQSNAGYGMACAFHSGGGKHGVAFVTKRSEAGYWYGFGSYETWRNDPITFPNNSYIPMLKDGQSHYATFGDPAGWPLTDVEGRYYRDGRNNNEAGNHAGDYWTGLYLYDPTDVLAGPELHSARPYQVARLDNPFNTTGNKYVYAGDYAAGLLFVPVEADFEGSSPVPVFCVYQLPV